MKTTNYKYAFLLFVTSIISYTLTAQTTFVRLYNKGNMGYCVREVNANSYVVAGSTDFYYNWHWFIMSSILNTNIHLFKTDASGVLQWERILSKNNTRLIARWMEPTLDGGFILTGSANSDAVWPPDSNDVVLVKTDANGMVSWSKVYNSGKDDLGFCVQQTADSGYIISGFHDNLPVSLVGNTYILLIKTDNTGNVQWEKKYQFAIRDLNTHEPFSYVVKQTADGGYIVTGTLASAHPADLDVLRTDAAGNLLWAKTYDHDNSVYRNSLGIDVIETSSGDFVIAGSMDKDSPLHLNYPYFLKLSSAGSVLKARFFETLPALMFQSGFSSVEETNDGGFFFTGMGGYSDFGDQAQLLRTDANLDMMWSRVYTVDGAATVGSMSGRSTSDGGYVFTGKRQMAGSMLMKTNDIGLILCKNPGTLNEYIPAITVQNWNPGITSGINAGNILLNSFSPLVDTTTICPVMQLSHLPVGLTYFAADPLPGNKVQLYWTTATEINNDYFIIEKSKDNTTFIETGMLKGAGNANNENHYKFIDEHPFTTPVSYYRLRQVDFNGNSYFSKTVSVNFVNTETEITSTYVDYANHSIKITLNTAENENATYTLTDALGKIIAHGSQTLNKGFSIISIDMKNAPKGIYFSSIKTGNKSLFWKLVY